MTGLAQPATPVPNQATAHAPISSPTLLSRDLISRFFESQLALVTRAQNVLCAEFQGTKFADSGFFLAGFARPHDARLAREFLTRLNTHHASGSGSLVVTELAAGRTYCENCNVGAPWLARAFATLAPGADIFATDLSGWLKVIYTSRDGTIRSMSLSGQQRENFQRHESLFPSLEQPPRPIEDHVILDILGGGRESLRGRLEHSLDRALTKDDRVFIRPDVDPVVEALISPLKAQAGVNYLELGSERAHQSDMVFGRFLFSPNNRDDVNNASKAAKSCLKHYGGGYVCFDRSAALFGEQITLELGTLLAGPAEDAKWNEAVAGFIPQLESHLTPNGDPDLQYASVALIGAYGIDTPSIRKALLSVSKLEGETYRSSNIEAEILLARLENRFPRWVKPLPPL